MNKRSGKTQWDYPDEDEQEEEVDLEGKGPMHEMEREREPPESTILQQEKRVDNFVQEEPSLSTQQTISEAHTEPVPVPVESNPPSSSVRKSSRHHKSHKHHKSHHKYTSEQEQVTSSTVGGALSVDRESVPIKDGMASSGTVSADTSSTNIGESLMDIEEDVSNTPLTDPVSVSAPEPEQSYDYSSVAAASVLQGQPPPPGTDLELLLSAPPPPPPPPIEEAIEQPSIHTAIEGSFYDNSSSYGTYGSDAGVLCADSTLQGSSMVQEAYVASSTPGAMTMMPSAYPVSDTTDDMLPSSSAYEQSDNGTTPIEEDNNVIAKPPQFISREPQVFSEPGSTVTSESVLPSWDYSGVQEEETLASGSGDVQSSNTYSEKKKKKKEKSMSSTNLTMKKKHVSSLVQKWQKVKKEVEIEERNREERDMAIRQKLEEWKQEY